MSQKIIRIGSSIGITVPKRLLKKLGVKQSDSIELNYNSRRDVIEISALKESNESHASLFGEVKSIIDKYQTEFDKLDD